MKNDNRRLGLGVLGILVFGWLLWFEYGIDQEPNPGNMFILAVLLAISVTSVLFSLVDIWAIGKK